MKEPGPRNETDVIEGSWRSEARVEAFDSLFAGIEGSSVCNML